MENSAIAGILDEVADFLEMDGANWFRVRAYRNGARAIRDLSQPAKKLIAEDPEALREIPGIGKDLAQAITELIEQGEFARHRELSEKYPEGILDLLKIPGLGPKRVKLLYDTLQISSREELKEAIEAERLSEVPGFGKKTAEKLLRRLQDTGKVEDRILLSEADEYVAPLLDHLRGCDVLERVEVAGSYRRRRETVGDLDLLAATNEPSKVVEHFLTYGEIDETVAHGETKVSVKLRGGLPVDLRVVEPDQYGAAMTYFTGSQAHNVELRKIAIARGLKLNEYGVFDEEENVASRTEEEVYQSLGLEYIPPELREARKEIEWSKAGSLPRLVETDDIRGELHAHTTATDGRATLKEMVQAARDRKYQYLAITDHSKRVTMAMGLDEERIRDQWSEIDQLNEGLMDFRVLKSVELDILEDGELDLPDDVLAEADFVLASIHYGAGSDERENTRRLVGAIKHPWVDAIGHPTGRLIGQRDPYPINLGEIIAAAAGEGCLIELNGNPKRMDLPDNAALTASTEGVRFLCATDSHAVRHLGFMRYAVDLARRAGLEADQIANSRNTDGFLGMLKRSQK